MKQIAERRIMMKQNEKRKNNLDERQEQMLLQVEHRGCWLAFWGLLIALMVQFIMGRDHENFGRARHPFMTGSGGWAYFSATRYMLGIRPEFDCLTVDPCIPADWKDFEVTRVWRGALYHIHVENPEGVCRGVARILVNGDTSAQIPVMPAGSETEVMVIMGNARQR